MNKVDYASHLESTLPVTNFILIIVGIGLSIKLNDPHWLNRLGALIAAIGAAAILLQLSIEISLEKDREEIYLQTKNFNASEAGSPLENLEIRLALKKLAEKQELLSRKRLKAATYVITTAMVGEILHGFGDIFMCHSFRFCGNH